MKSQFYAVGMTLSRMLVARLGTFVGGAVIGVGATVAEQDQFVSAVTALALVVSELVLSRILGIE